MQAVSNCSVQDKKTLKIGADAKMHLLDRTQSVVLVLRGDTQVPKQFQMDANNQAEQYAVT